MIKDGNDIYYNVIDDDFRTPFYRDIDRIIYSLSYTRYMDKTQVFSFNENDNISKRMTHVQMVSKIARTIGRALNLNEDLIEAAALGHDLGHVPFGHTGERILNEISLRVGEGYFNHNIQSVRTLMEIENNGYGSNVTLQVLDAVMCHNGELELKEYRPRFDKTKEEFLHDYEMSYKDQNVIKTFVPMTLEGCVVRISDIIAYIGRDIEDAIRMGIIKENEVPVQISSVLGVTNSEIINNIIIDLVNNSLDKDYLRLSDDKFIITPHNAYNSKDAVFEMERMLKESLLDVLNNQEIRNRAFEKDVYYWEIARRLGIRPETFSKLLREELDPRQKEKVLNAIDEISNSRHIGHGH